MVVLLLVVACAGKPPVATPADALRANVPLAQLAQGRTLLIQKCGGCHKPPLPGDHAAHEWPTSLAEMSGRAKLDGAQQHAIETYLLAMLARPQTAAR
ncbi:MAG: hypothetical protein NT062_03600 [Proteobacteria bacterium]|nr:hypothetical protein [Pseudomonadota bacterium]